jgi:hypothetical protein
MINLINKDCFIYDLEYKSIDIVKEYFDTGKIEIKLNNEGLCLEKCGFYDFLDHLSDVFNIDKSKITIRTQNALEKHDQYNIIIVRNYYIRNKRFNRFIDSSYVPVKMKQLKTVGCFVGKASWHRLILVSWLFNYFKEQCLLTCNYTGSDSNKAYMRLDEVNFYYSKMVKQVILFLEHTPLTLDNRYDDISLGPSESLGSAKIHTEVLNLLNYYDQIFLDLGTETYVMGNTFFPTEKTTRPIVAKTPFIVMGPKNYLSNLRAIGFKTFHQWWDESYDHLEGTARIIEIQRVITNIMQWPQERLQTVLLEMQEILEHNYKCNYSQDL